MPPDPTCPECGAALAADAAEGLCAACLLRQVVDGDEPVQLAEGVRLRYLGDYELIEEIGRGAMGVVFRARQLSLGREVAVKLLLGGAWASEVAVERFRAEARAAAALRHPGIVAIHEVGEHEGQPYFSMDLVEGHDLGEELRVGALEVHRAAELVAELAEAVDYAHERGILHRDLKPSNVLIDRAGRPSISDFGLAKNLALASDLTFTGQVLGTPGYMSPEQARGQGPDDRPALDRRTDVYSLGAILYALLTGRPPFEGEGPVETALAQLRDAPVAPRELRPEVARDLEAICLKCLAFEPADRYATAWDLAADLRGFLAGRSVSARPVGWGTLGWRWCRRHLSLVVSGLILALALLVLGRAELRVGAVGAPPPTIAAVAPEPTATAPSKPFSGSGLTPVHSFPAILTAALSFSEDGQRLAMRSVVPPGHQALEVYDVATGRRVASLSGAAGSRLPGSHVRLDRRLPALLTKEGGRDVLRLWNPVAGQALELHPPSALAEDAEADRWLLSPAGTRLVWGSRQSQGQLGFWNTARGDVEILPVAGRPVTFLGDDEMLFLQSNALFVWSFSAGRVRTPVPPEEPLAISRDGGTAVLRSGVEPALEVWDLRSETRIATVPDSVDLAAQALLSPDGRLLALGGADDPKGLRVWNTAVVPLGPCTMALGNRRSALLTSAAFSPDGQLLAALGNNLGTGTVWVWDARTGALVAGLENQQTPVWSPDGRWLATAGKAASGQPLKQVSYESKLQLSGFEISGGAVNLWRVAPPVPAVALPSGPVRWLAWEPAGDRLAMNGVLGELSRTTPRLLRPLRVVEGADGILFDAGGHPWALGLAEIGLDDGSQPLRLLRVEPSVQEIVLGVAEGVPVSAKPRLRALATDVLLGPDGKSLIVAARLRRATSEDGEAGWVGGALESWDLETGRRSVLWRSEQASAIWTGALAASPDGSLFAVDVEPEASSPQGIVVWDWKAAKRLRIVQHTRPRAIAFTDDGRRLVSVGFFGSIEATDLITGQRAAWSARQGELLSLSISTDSRWLATGGMGAEIALWHLESQTEIARWPAHEGRVTALAFHPERSLLASGGADGVVKLWDLEAIVGGLEEQALLARR